MTQEELTALLVAVSEQRLPISSAVEKLSAPPLLEMTEGLTLDTHRQLRLGIPEVVYAKHKTVGQVLAALRALTQVHGSSMATLVSPEMAGQLAAELPEGIYDVCSRIFRVGKLPAQNPKAIAVVLCAGTSDLPVAEEAAQTLEFAGWTVRRVTDVGVAGLHRLLNKLDAIRQSRVVIAVAGMEGALPSVVAGLVSQPVIAVPTSVGYGANLQGLTTLLSMLNSCSSGIGVVNIDNGFGAAMLAIRFLQEAAKSESSPAS